MAYVYRDGSRLTPWMKYCIDRFSAAMQAELGESILVTSGIRTYQEQVDIFRRRYRIASQVNGRRVYDTRVWNGVRWYRIDPTGTVAVPGTSNHEVQGNKAAADLRDTGRDKGITTRGTARANWARANAYKYGLTPSGYNFGEPWHFDIPDIFRTPPAAPAGGGTSTPVITKEVLDMSTEVIVTVKDRNNKALADSARRAAFINTDSGFNCDVSWLTIADANKWAAQVGMPSGAIQLTDTAFDKYVGRLNAVGK